MKDPQVISVLGENPDAVMAIWGGAVIDDTTQVPIVSPTTLTVDVYLFNVTTGTFPSVLVDSATMQYDANSGYWYILLNSGAPVLNAGVVLLDRNKYTARITEHTPAANNVRPFVLEEFAIDNGSFEDTLMRLPFHIDNPAALSNNMHIIWYDTDAHMLAGNLTYAKYKAPAYEGGTGSTYATDASRVTHRGATVPY